jgi:hypothetical protein
MLSEIRDHIESKLAAATIEMDPCPHLVIENFFPDAVYEKILEYNPFNANRGVEWLDEKQSLSVSGRTPYHARKQINFHRNQDFSAPDEQLLFWRSIKDCFLGDDWFPTLVQEKFPVFFDLRFGSLAREHDFISLFRRELFLQRHEPGYYIGPHTDIPTRVFTCIFSFASTDGYEKYGTEFLVHKDRMARCWGNDHYKPEDFLVKKVAPYKPNNFLLFFKTRHSFHSVRAIPEDVPNQRYGMQFQFYEPSGGLMRDLSVPDLMVVTRRNPDQKPPQKRLKARIKEVIGM